MWLAPKSDEPLPRMFPGQGHDDELPRVPVWRLVRGQGPDRVVVLGGADSKVRS